MTNDDRTEVSIDAAVVVLLLPLIYHSFRKSLTNRGGVLMTLYRATVCRDVTLLKAKMGQKYVLSKLSKRRFARKMTCFVSMLPTVPLVKD